MSRGSVVVVLGILVLLQSAAPHAQSAGADATNPLLVIERHRASVVQRIVSDWSDLLGTLPADQRMTREQLTAELSGLRADRLLAASLAGSFATIQAVLAESRDERAGAGMRRVSAKVLGDANADLTYTPVNPCRIADTRFAGGALGANVTRTFDGFNATSFAFQGGTASNCGMPNGVAAIAMNVYAVNPTSLGFIKVWPANGAEPAVSTINYQPGITAIASGTIVPVDAGSSNRFSARSPAPVDFIADVVGYFSAPAGKYFMQGGNAFGADAVVGTKDSFALDLRVNGARAMRYEPDLNSPNLIGGHAHNAAAAPFYGQTIGGGGSGGSNCYDEATNVQTRICANLAGGYFATIGGGVSNVSSGDSATIGGGQGNNADLNAATVGGGFGNRAINVSTTVAGGIGNLASGQAATVGGGGINRATGFGSTVIGGTDSQATGPFATVAGGYANIASGQYSFAAGNGARTETGDSVPIVHDGVFLWADYGQTVVPFRSTAPNEFAARATGGVRFVTAIDVVGTPVKQVRFDTNGNVFASGTFNPVSDRDAKEHFADVDVRDVLEKVGALRVTTWRYKGDSAGAVHMGPVAQDFSSAFSLGQDDKHIATVDADGVALAAIQGLNAKVEEQRREIGELRRALADLRRILDAPAVAP